MQGSDYRRCGELNGMECLVPHAGMLDGVMVEAYGAKMPLNQVANVTAPEAQMLLVTPFDPSHVTAISTAIRDNHSLGFNPSDDGRVVRVPVPALTEERRKQLVKQVSEKVEEARIAMRTIRQDALKDAFGQCSSHTAKTVAAPYKCCIVQGLP